MRALASLARWLWRVLSTPLRRAQVGPPFASVSGEYHVRRVDAFGRSTDVACDARDARTARHLFRTVMLAPGERVEFWDGNDRRGVRA